MKSIIVLLFTCCFSFLQAQDNPVQLNSEVKHLEGDKYELIITAEIDPDWCMYSQDLPEDGPFPTTISFPKSKYIQLVGRAAEESEDKKVVDDHMFNLKLTKFFNNVIFRQVVIVKNKAKVKKIKADVGYMSCNMQMCMPPMQEELEFEIDGK